MLELRADGQWPLWNGASEADGYGNIAAYVTPAPVDRLIPPGYRRELEHLPGGRQDTETVTRLWQALAGKGLRYAEPPWEPSQRQRIRDPEWLLRRIDRGSGTCIDLSLLFAAQCLNEELDTYLVMLRGQAGGHVMVAVRLGRNAGLKASSDVLPGTGRGAGNPGVLTVDDRDALIGSKHVLLLDVVQATTEDAAAGSSLDAAAEAARQYLSDQDFEHAHLVDVAVRQTEAGDEPLETPRTRGALRTRITRPGGPAPFAAHAAARSALTARTGKIVVSGPQGVGKSTLARIAAVSHDAGYGWFLNASSREAFDTALAEHELIESGADLSGLEAVDRAAKARDALSRLGRTADHWVIVLDNANAGASGFDAARYAVDRLPAPREGQLIIATSTAGPGQWPGWEPALLPPVPYPQLKELGHPLAAELSAGRPLLWAAFTSLLSVPSAEEELVKASLARRDGGATPDTGPTAGDESARQAAALLWSVSRGHLDPGAVACAERMAWLPPDRIEPGLAGDDEAVLAALTGTGLLVSSASAGAAAMHRLFGAAIRAAVAAEGTAEAVTRDLLARPEALASLLRYGDAEVTGQLAGALAGSQTALALWALATLQELYGGGASTATFEAAEALLTAPAGQAERSALADCLHARARAVNQKGDASREEIEAAILVAGRAIELRDQAEGNAAEQTAIAKHEAVLALLRQRAAKFIADRAARIRELREVLELLTQSWKRRLGVLGPDHPLVDRAYYNLAGVQVSLAKLDPASAGPLMAEARRVYEVTRDFRRRHYNGANPITAASVNGIGIWGYESIRLGLVADPGQVLTEAIDAVAEALGMRRESGIANDIEKSASLLARLALLQIKVTTAKPGKPEGKAAAAVVQAVSELDLRAPVTAALSPANS